MKSSRFILLASVAAAAAAAPAQSPMEIARKANAEYERAVKAGDFASFDRNSTRDFVYIDRKGRRSPKAESLASMKAMMPAIHYSRYATRVLSAKAADGGVVYLQDTAFTGTMSMGKAKPMKMVSHSVDEVLLVKQKGHGATKWVKNRKNDTTVDGKPMAGM